jgi:hypothetical protein
LAVAVALFAKSSRAGVVPSATAAEGAVPAAPATATTDAAAPATVVVRRDDDAATAAPATVAILHVPAIDGDGIPTPLDRDAIADAALSEAVFRDATVVPEVIRDATVVPEEIPWR